MAGELKTEPCKDAGRADAGRSIGATEDAAGRRLAAARRREAFPDTPLTVLVTASGAPGSPRLLRALRENGERTLRLVGTDVRERSAGRFLCDSFATVPAGDDPGFADALLAVAGRERVDVVFPQSSAEVEAIAAAAPRFGVPVLVSSLEAVRRASDKAQTVAAAERLGIPQPETIQARDAAAFLAACAALGYPGRDVCMKPLAAKGARGFRVLSARVDRREQLLRARPGELLPLAAEEAAALLDAGGEFPAMLVMELVRGPELAVDALCRRGRPLVIAAKTREAFRAGLGMEFELLDRPDLVAHASALIAELHLDWLVNVQFLGDHLLEVNPRISTLVYQPEINLPWLAVKLALGEASEEEVAGLGRRLRSGRVAVRYYEQVEYDPAQGPGAGGRRADPPPRP